VERPRMPAGDVARRTALLRRAALCGCLPRWGGDVTGDWSQAGINAPSYHSLITIHQSPPSTAQRFPNH
jgi:hypothetical protein